MIMLWTSVDHTQREDARFDWSTWLNACVVDVFVFSLSIAIFFSSNVCTQELFIGWKYRKEINDPRQWKKEKRKKCVQRCRSEIDWSRNSSCNGDNRYLSDVNQFCENISLIVNAHQSIITFRYLLSLPLSVGWVNTNNTFVAGESLMWYNSYMYCIGIIDDNFLFTLNLTDFSHPFTFSPERTLVTSVVVFFTFYNCFPPSLEIRTCSI